MTRMMNLTAALGLGALMVMSAGCTGDKSTDAGTDSGDTEGDADADTDSDSDTDTEPTYFDDYAVPSEQDVGLGGEGHRTDLSS